MGVLDNASSLSTPGLLLGTIASVGRGKENEPSSQPGTLERGRGGASSLKNTLERPKSPASSLGGSLPRGSSLGGTLERGAGSRTTTLDRKGTLQKSNSFLNKTSTEQLGTPGLLSSLPRGGAEGLRDGLKSPSARQSPGVRSPASTLDRRSPGVRSPAATLDRRSPSAERGRSLIDEGQWLSLERRGGSPSKELARAESQEKEDYGDLTKARTFWKDLDTELVRRQSQDHGGSRRESKDLGGSRRESKDFGGSRRESKDFGGSRRESKDFGGSRRESKDFGGSLANETIGSIRRESKDAGSLRRNGHEGRSRSKEPLPDYDMEVDSGRSRSTKKASSGVVRQEPVAKRRRDSRSGDHRPLSPAERAMSPSVPWEERSRSRRGSSAGQEADYDRGRRNSTDMATLERRAKEDRNLEGRAASLSRKGSNAAALAKRRESNPDESQHFLSLQLFTAHAEPSLDEYLPLAKQLELEHKQREEEDALYRNFLRERREQEDVVYDMEDGERDELFDRMNKMERSRIINMADKHCTQMMDLIHREKVTYLTEGGEEVEDIKNNYPRDPPEIRPPEHKKDDVYENNMAVFETVDETAKDAAKETYHTFASLVRILVKHCTSELDKARAIFRFITEKKFEHRNWFLYYPEEGNTRGAPTDLLRGVEFGIETKALLYKRMCAYAGLHAIVIKGFCKAKEYKPSEEFVDNRWRNAWNAVYVAGGWRLVQPNWAAMQVQTKAARETRQIYQDHYFLTDPDKFIFEFFPLKAEHQFLEHPITKDEFEQLPLLRSTFFHFGLGLARSEGLVQATINCDDKGEANLYLNSQKDVSFHYTLTNFKTGSTSVKAPGGKFPLGRFVMMSTREEETTFNLHVPQAGTFLLEVGAAPYPTAEQCLAKLPVYYINVCKFKIVSRKVARAMVPLPDCVPGEWGPNKAEKLFGLTRPSHPMPIIYAAPPSNIDLRQDDRPLTLNIEFEKTRPVLDFVTKLYKNGMKEDELRKMHRYRIKDNYVIFDIKVPQDGQYGLDIYTRERWEDKMLHVCKYLINCDV